MEPLTLFLATVIGAAVSNALKPDAFIGSAIGGIIGNRVDASFVKGFNGLIGLVQGGNTNTQQELQQAIGRSMIAAQQSMIKECLKSQGLSEADRWWLQQRRQELDLDLKELENLPQKWVPIASRPARQVPECIRAKLSQVAPKAIDAVAVSKLLLPPDAGEKELIALRREFAQVAELPGAPVVYLDLVRSSFFERVCGCFGLEVRDRVIPSLGSRSPLVQAKLSALCTTVI